MAGAAAGPRTSDGAGVDDEASSSRAYFSDRIIGCFVAVGIVVALVALLLPTDGARSFVFDACSLCAAGAAVYGILRNQPEHRGIWQLFALGLLLFAAGDVVFDVAQRGFGRSDGYPFADVLYLAAYPVLAIALVRLARSRFSREIALDSAVVAVALSTVLWQWVVAPVFQSSTGTTLERIITVAYPVMDILLVVVIVHAVFTLPRWTPAAWLLLVGLALMLFGDALFARLVAEGAYHDGGVLDALWPIAYLLLAAAVMHPSMRALWDAGDAGLVRHGRARMVLLGAALFAAPAVVVVDGSGSPVVLAVITGIAAAGVAWRITRMVDETNGARVVLAESEARFRALVQHATDIIVVIDGSGRMTYISPAVDHVFGREADDLVGTGFVEYLDAGGVEQGRMLYERLLAHPDEPVNTEFHVFDGTSWRWVEATWTNQLHEQAVHGIVGNLRDITDRKRAAAFAQAQTRVLELTLSGAPIPETLTVLVEALEEYVPDGAGSIRMYDPDQDTLVSVAAPSLPSEHIRAMTELTTIEDVQAAFGATGLRVTRDVATGGATPSVARLCISRGLRGLWSMPIRTPDGQDFLGVFSFFVRTVRDPQDDELEMLERARDLAAVALDRDARTKELGHLALHDTLTGLPNRALVQDRIDHALARLADIDDDDATVAVLFVDLDRFKLVNDGLGHETGDELLVAVSERLTATVRRQDTVARFGGDEFVVLCEDLTQERQAIELAERTALAFAEPFALSRAEVTVSASIGIAVTDRGSDRAANLLQDADAAMYRAKRRGGGRHELFDEAMHTQAVSRLLTEHALRRALQHDELRVLFQPQFDLASGERVAVEALLRWNHPVRGLVLPGDFLRVAEETGIIVPIGEWVLARACELVRSSRADGPSAGGLPVSLNVSARQLQRPDFPDVVANVVRDYVVDPGLLCLEVAESALLDDLDATDAGLRALKALGVRLAIDDFGTGGSSLTYLRRFPFDELKIDHMFVEGLGRSAADDAIVAATIDMAHALGMAVSAEGVETEGQRARLCELGCDRAQGYHLGAPEALAARRLVLLEQRPA
jgi:diguanylate cyclase (GGDEF)-like protein/PAS domain S-box-containing protein